MVEVQLKTINGEIIIANVPALNTGDPAPVVITTPDGKRAFIYQPQFGDALKLYNEVNTFVWRAP